MSDNAQTTVFSIHRLLTFAALATAIIVLAQLNRLTSSGTASPSAVANLEIPVHVGVDSQGVAAIPVRFAADGLRISAALFSIDYDEQCLLFDPVDANRDGFPDNVLFNLPSQFIVSASFNALDTDGELHIMMVDYSPPYASLPEQTLLTVRLAALYACERRNNYGASRIWQRAPAESEHIHRQRGQLHLHRRICAVRRRSATSHPGANCNGHAGTYCSAVGDTNYSANRHP